MGAQVNAKERSVDCDLPLIFTFCDTRPEKGTDRESLGWTTGWVFELGYL